MASKIGRVDLKAGITFEQANVIGRYYFQHYIAGRGAAYPAIDRGLRWEITPIAGIAGTRIKDPIVVEKRTGRISWIDGSTLSLTSLLDSKEAAPKPTHKSTVNSPKHLPSSAPRSTIQIQFVVLPSGATSDFTFEHSSASLRCDLAARRTVEGWRFSPRKQPITLVAGVETCTN